MKNHIPISFFLVFLGFFPLAHSQIEIASPPDDALSRDAEALASRTDSGAAHADALRRLKFQSEEKKMKISSKLREEFASRIAGIYTEHTPRDRIVVRLKGIEPVESRVFFSENGIVIPVDFFVAQDYSKSDLENILGEKRDLLNEKIPFLQGSGTDDETGEIVLVILKNKSKSAKDSEVSAREILGVPVRIMEIENPEERQAVIRGGGSIMSCTAGFVVTQGYALIRRGILSAAHCGEGIRIFSDGIGNQSLLKYEDGLYTAEYDFQWYTNLYTSHDYNFEPKFYATSFTSDLRNVTGTISRSATNKNDYLCHRGHTTGHSCGVVYMTNYQRTSCNAFVCSNTWVMVVPATSNFQQLACFGGDSGGPWFQGGSAVGIHVAGAVTQAGQCIFSVYMSIDEISALNLTVLTF